MPAAFAASPVAVIANAFVGIRSDTEADTGIDAEIAALQAEIATLSQAARTLVFDDDVGTALAPLRVRVGSLGASGGRRHSCDRDQGDAGESCKMGA